MSNLLMKTYSEYFSGNKEKSGSQKFFNDNKSNSFLLGVEEIIAEGVYSQSLAAHALNMSCRTLQRKLKCHNVCFSELVNKVRAQYALDLIRSGNKSMLDISLELGYNDPSNFTKAFKRWYGMCPRNVGSTTS